MSTIQKIHLSISGRQLFFRTCGSGPILMILHPSPQHSGRMEGLMSVFADRFQVVAPDTPGYGYSEALEPAPQNLSDYCVFIETIREYLGVSSFYLYGTATGAQLVIAYALSYPENLRYIFLDNAVHFEDSQRQEILQHYFISLEPEPNDSHLVRLREMVERSCLFFPWFSRDEKHRIANSLPASEVISQMMEDYLMAGTDYARAYRAAFLHEKAENLQRLITPTLIFRWLGSPLLPYINQLLQHPLPEQIGIIDTPIEMKARWQQMRESILSVIETN